jgi:hypothetical protein
MSKETDALKTINYLQLQSSYLMISRLERKYYYNKKDQAQRNPSQHMSIIIDGMDQGWYLKCPYTLILTGAV